MNSKKAKALRRDARMYSSAAPEKNTVVLPSGQIINSLYSQRGVYRRLKKKTKGV